MHANLCWFTLLCAPQIQQPHMRALRHLARARICVCHLQLWKYTGCSGFVSSFHNISPEGSPTLDKQKMSYAHSAYLLLVQNEGCPKFALVAELIFFFNSIENSIMLACSTHYYKQKIFSTYYAYSNY